MEGGFNNIRGFGLSVAATWDVEHGFRDWFEYDAIALVKEMAQFDRVIGFNLLSFDYEVLSDYIPDVHKLLDDKTFDILADLTVSLGHRVSLEDISLATLGRKKVGTGYDAVRWFREGEIEKVARHCQRDVELTRDIYEYGRERGFIYYPSKGELAKVKVDWR